jgi:hypothetical protein
LLVVAPDLESSWAVLRLGPRDARVSLAGTDEIDAATGIATVCVLDPWRDPGWWDRRLETLAQVAPTGVRILLGRTPGSLAEAESWSGAFGGFQIVGRHHLGGIAFVELAVADSPRPTTGAGVRVALAQDPPAPSDSELDVWTARLVEQDLGLKARLARTPAVPSEPGSSADVDPLRSGPAAPHGGAPRRPIGRGPRSRRARRAAAALGALVAGLLAAIAVTADGAVAAAAAMTLVAIAVVVGLLALRRLNGRLRTYARRIDEVLTQLGALGATTDDLRLRCEKLQVDLAALSRSVAATDRHLDAAVARMDVVQAAHLDLARRTARSVGRTSTGVPPL